MKIVSSEQMRRIEQIAIKEHDKPAVTLMRNAAVSLAKHCLSLINKNKYKSVLIIAGPGNNGGDGMALVRYLQIKELKIKVIFIGETDSNMSLPAHKLSSPQYEGNPAAVYLARVRELGVPMDFISPAGDFPADKQAAFKTDLESHDLVVDAIFGTGLTRYVQGIFKQIIEMINCYAKHVVSADIPSGVNSDTGQIMGCAVKAAQTITFSSPKIGLYVYPGAEYAGKIHVEDIDIPPHLIDLLDVKTEILTDEEAKNKLPVRGKRTNKGNFGKVYVFAGSNEMPGAAALVCSASYKTGCGLVCACVIPNVASVIHHWQREVITRFVPEKNGMYCKDSLKNLTEEMNQASVIVVGPGIGRSAGVTEFVREIITTAKVPLVLDADALFAVSEGNGILNKLKAPCIITPHPGEMSKLTGLSIPEILDNIIEIAVKFSKDFNVVTLLKDAHTIIANPDGRYYINTTGCSALSKAGTGDVLTGMIAGYIAQGVPVFEAGALGAYYHGKAGEAAAVEKSCYGVQAGDLLE